MISGILNSIFNAIISIVMFLCFFALSSNMSANLIDQKKEIAVLRSMGMNKCRLRMLYFYEALILVFTSCALGVGIGLLVGYTMFL
jgi:lipoprotein-releasing system permease protein